MKLRTALPSPARNPFSCVPPDPGEQHRVTGEASQIDRRIAQAAADHPPLEAAADAEGLRGTKNPDDPIADAHAVVDANAFRPRCHLLGPREQVLGNSLQGAEPAVREQRCGDRLLESRVSAEHELPVDDRVSGDRGVGDARLDEARQRPPREASSTGSRTC